MKKLLLAITAMTIGHIASAQLSLLGSEYIQNFNGLSSTAPVLPAGWQLSVTATSNALGTDVTSSKYDASGRTWKSVSNGFRNVASANGYTSFSTIGNDSLAQAQRTDRALAIRQTGAVGDSSTAFMLKIASTQNLTNFKLDFKLQSLDSTSPRSSIWLVDYGIGATPTSFMPATITSTTPLTTGGNTFSNKAVSASFGNGLDNKAGTVWIRIVTLTKTTGSGNRATSAIDDVHLTWSGNATGVNEVSGLFHLPLTIIGTSKTDNITLQYNVKEAGNYTLNIYDLTGRIVSSRMIAATVGKHQLVVDDLDLHSGMYIMKMNNDTYSGTVKAIVQ